MTRADYGVSWGTYACKPGCPTVCMRKACRVSVSGRIFGRPSEPVRSHQQGTELGGRQPNPSDATSLPSNLYTMCILLHMCSVVRSTTFLSPAWIDIDIDIDTSRKRSVLPVALVPACAWLPSGAPPDLSTT